MEVCEPERLFEGIVTGTYGNVEKVLDLRD